MITWIVIIGLILFGLGLIIVEIIFVPGTTIVGIMGLLLAAFGVYMSFSNFGATTGTIVLLSSAVVGLITIFVSFRSGVWRKFALKDKISSKFNEHIDLSMNEGDEGVTISSLKPIGKAEFNEKVFEVRSNGNFIEAGKNIKVVKVKKNKIIVELINQSE